MTFDSEKVYKNIVSFFIMYIPIYIIDQYILYHISLVIHITYLLI